MARVDAHQHYWHPARGDYGWMPKDDPVSRDPTVLPISRRYLAELAIEKTVLVQAAPTVEETEYLLGIADATDSVAGVVGWIDFEKPEHIRHLRRFANHPKFLGVRPMIQDIADDGWMLRPDVRRGFEAVTELDLTFDALGFPRHLANFLSVFKRYTRMRVVIDHCMKPQIGGGSMEMETYRHWAEGMTRLAEETGVYCKLSGLVTEAGAHWSVEQLQPYAEHVLTVFGPQRVMWGSDWPVCLLRASFGEWRRAAEVLTAHLDAPSRERVFGGTAADFYRL